ncbi:ATP-binding protein [Candidatus Methylobacter oryzae]|uniref:histidine kinase n=1 Tax=Candidatus Methylobacter oryzae TaxID=2497749 RepID=A0ABY3CB96_9GAMM|nr:ATP-binding protein [Candidatus Methylobacter oryzae]TRW95260.1 response regulator [Candidatus Methylobacter oryzae]
MPDQQMTISVAEWEKLKQRATKLALDKSNQQLVMQLMRKMGEASGLNNVIDNMLRSIVDVIGGANLVLYYKIDADIFSADVYGEKHHLHRVDDQRVSDAFATGEASEFEHDFSDTRMLTPAFTHAYTWIYPLKVGSTVIGVFKMESLHVAMRDLHSQLPLFFNYAALVLKNEILGHTRLQHINSLLQQEIIIRKQTERELVAAKNEAEAANRAKSIFLANMSHELRTPMNAVLGFSQLMQRDGDLSPSQRETLNIINNSGKHLLELINDVLDMAKIEAGRVVIENGNFDLGALVLSIIDMMHERAEAKGLELLLDQASDFPRFVSSDEPKLRQILLNLVGNAIKYTQKGQVVMRLTAEDLPEIQKCLLLFEIKDTGIGISEHDLPFVFDTFVQVGRESDQQGSGLGLRITKQYAELMGGQVTVTSELNKGSSFTLKLPVTAVNQSEIIDKLVLDGKQILGLAPGQPNYRILIVEDQLENRLLLRKLMESVGFEVFEAVNGQQGIKQFIHCQPHLIWMDRRMPIMDGITATQKIRALPGGDKVKIVAVTASVFTEQRQEFIDAGVEDIVGKPYRDAEIFACMTKHLGVRFVYDELAGQKTATEQELNGQHLKQLPEALLSELQQAAVSLDIEQSLAVIERIKTIDESLAEVLAGRVNQFDFEAITKLLDDTDIL